MELQTTIRDFPNKISSLNLPPDTSIRVVIELGETPGEKIEAGDEVAEKKGRWAQVAEELAAANVLEGRSEEVNKLFREFRDNFSFERK
ncbi:MAG: hypothetical protein HQK57_07520 [Deltaproteobacteria bacterium]|nr:hypothetical protein [Deltaproteobacteria bacterium]MBF0508758.1 hypothetical protein [Deltaproteobacteria bacterium]MBF0524856.1 hypothetical protein [Deltaproteobacteria bacterium]